MQTLSAGISEIAERYDALLCDLWGVIHDGEHLYPGVLETLEALHRAGKPVMFLSNAPRLAESVLVKMDKMGVKREWYAGALTSGEAARRYLQEMPQFAVAQNAFLLGAYYYQGLESDEALLEGMPQRRVASVEEADFILCGNFDYHGQPFEELHPKLERAAARKLPMLCINPDLEVVKLDGTRILCAGYLAAEYEKMGGGQVGYIGKPHPLVYEMAMDLLNEGGCASLASLPPPLRASPCSVGEHSQDLGVRGSPQPLKTLMIGDNLLTDIKGGKAAGMDTLLVAQGVLKPEDVAAECRALGVTPDYLTAAFLWRE